MYNARKLLVGMFLPFLLIVLYLYPTKVYAATQISSVKIKVVEKASSDENPEIRCSTFGCFIVSDTTFWSKDVKDCRPGEGTNVSITLDTEDGFFFKDDIKKSKIQVTNGECIDWSCQNGQLMVKIKYIVHGELDSPEDVYWDEDYPGRARWEEVNTKVTYTLQICRGSHKETIATGLTRTSYDLSNKLATDYYFGRDDVYFRVKAVPKSNYSRELDSSEYVESEYFEDWDELDYYDDYSDPSESSRHYNGWENVYGRWRYYNYRGELVKNNWGYIKGLWYHFDSEGWMNTGWQLFNNQWYYFDSVNGNMLTGWHYINGYWYFFDMTNGYMYKDTYLTSTDGKMVYYIQPNGKMQTGWVKYYGHEEKYIDPVSGIVTMTR